jgi:hypothetical protein
VRRAVLLLVLVLVLALPAGCGNEPTPAPDTRTPDAPRGTREVSLQGTGISFTAPFNWPDLQRQGLRVGGIQNKRATVAIWRYPRSEPLPASDGAVGEAQKRLVDRVRRRDPRFEVRSSTIARRGGARAIEVVGRQTIGGLPFGVRSSHIFHAGDEIVVDAYAPPEDFDRVDRTVFEPLLDSLRLSR